VLFPSLDGFFLFLHALHGLVDLAGLVQLTHILDFLREREGVVGGEFIYLQFILLLEEGVLLDQTTTIAFCFF
jgi:hypothetical protein